jgi:hypothetical protein
MFSIDIEQDGMEQAEKMIGISWAEFVDKSNDSLNKEI